MKKERNMEKERNMGYPCWVEDELWNWSRWCWLGDWPQPDPNVKCISAERAYRALAGPDDEPAPIPVHMDHARKVQSCTTRWRTSSSACCRPSIRAATNTPA